MIVVILQEKMLALVFLLAMHGEWREFHHEAAGQVLQLRYIVAQDIMVDWRAFRYSSKLSFLPLVRNLTGPRGSLEELGLTPSPTKRCGHGAPTAFRRLLARQTSSIVTTTSSIQYSVRLGLEYHLRKHVIINPKVSFRIIAHCWS